MSVKLFLRPKDLMVLKDYSTYNTAWQAYRRLKDCLGKQKHQHITLREFADYEGIDIAEVYQTLDSFYTSKNL